MKDGIPRCLFGGYGVAADNRDIGYYGPDHCWACHEYVNAAVAREDARQMAEQSFTDRVEQLFRQRPGEWINARDFMQIGGTMAWRSRIAEVRTQRGLNIVNRQRRAKNRDNKAYTISEYKWQAEPEPVALSVDSQGQSSFL